MVANAVKKMESTNWQIVSTKPKILSIIYWFYAL